MFVKDTPAPPVVFNEGPTLDQVIGAINRNTLAAGLLHSNVRVSMDGMPAGLTGTMVTHAPGKVRLNVGLIGMTQSGIDIGSNDQEFWIWNKSSFGGQQPTIYFARHAEYAGSQANQQLRIEPRWIIDALGLVRLDPDSPIEGPYTRADGRIELRVSESAGPRTITRLVVVDPRHGWVQQQAFYDSNNQRIAYATATKHRYFPEYDVNLPQNVEIHVFDAHGQEMVLNIQIKSYGEFHGDPTQIWERPQPADVPAIDLSHARLGQAMEHSSVQPSSRVSGLQPHPPTRPDLKGFDLLKR